MNKRMTLFTITIIGIIYVSYAHPDWIIWPKIGATACPSGMIGTCDKQSALDEYNNSPAPISPDTPAEVTTPALSPEFQGK